CGFNNLADQLDGLIANYTAYNSKKDVQEEVALQEVILANEPDTENRPSLSLKLAHLAAALGNHARVVELLEPFTDVRDANRCELLLDFGSSLCKVHHDTPSSAEYLRGRHCIEE